jgi:hypothetical protein
MDSLNSQSLGATSTQPYDPLQRPEFTQLLVDTDDFADFGDFIVSLCPS